MPLTADEIRHVATLARLGLSEEEITLYGEQLPLILAHIATMEKVDTSQVPATASVSGLTNVWRDDESRASLPVDEALANAPQKESGFFIVGKIQESE
jgi:aspartyl-tRNA(Asn)/glutamyl-tRNA(Gln) amidotransferase subunit C